MGLKGGKHFKLVKAICYTYILAKDIHHEMMSVLVVPISLFYSLVYHLPICFNTLVNSISAFHTMFR